MQVEKYCRIGTRNLERNLPCQDWVSHETRGSVTAIALADGTGTTAHATAGAMVTAQILTRHLSKNFRRLLACDDDALRYDVLATVRKALYDLCDTHETGLNRLSSTFLAAAADSRIGQFLLVHLGDGIAAAENDQGVQVLSYGENGPSRRYTVLTSTQGALPHVKILRGSTNGMKRLFLCSDGWGDHAFSCFDPQHQICYDDDTSAIGITFHCKRATI